MSVREDWEKLSTRALQAEVKVAELEAYSNELAERLTAVSITNAQQAERVSQLDNLNTVILNIIDRSGIEGIYNWGAPLREIRTAITATTRQDLVVRDALPGEEPSEFAKKITETLSKATQEAVAEHVAAGRLPAPTAQDLCGCHERWGKPIERSECGLHSLGLKATQERKDK